MDANGGLVRRGVSRQGDRHHQELTATPELNKTYMGKVQRITDFGAFIEIMPGLDGLLHVSEIAHYRVKDVRDELKEGDSVMVKVINIDPSGKIRLSRSRRSSPPEGTPEGGQGGGAASRAPIAAADPAAIANPRAGTNRGRGLGAGSWGCGKTRAGAGAGAATRLSPMTPALAPGFAPDSAPGLSPCIVELVDLFAAGASKEQPSLRSANSGRTVACMCSGGDPLTAAETTQFCSPAALVR
jgi:hypothetical protein